ncbi:hypothetical protein [Ectobacillus panaciterrae]|uniref:hypothetical protein n=1 Tax=Ectobacillus panaciterrae TaxID=363872 RepID=UPI0004299DE3|nr:hypothetical protein [Ectobacillus panaciterrae]
MLTDQEMWQRITYLPAPYKRELIRLVLEGTSLFWSTRQTPFIIMLEAAEIIEPTGKERTTSQHGVDTLEIEYSVLPHHQQTWIQFQEYINQLRVSGER